jgi:hypothetical protein
MKADLVVKNGHVVTPRETFEGGVAIARARSSRSAQRLAAARISGFCGVETCVPLMRR